MGGLRNRSGFNPNPSAFGLLILPPLATPHQRRFGVSESENEVGEKETEARCTYMLIFNPSGAYDRQTEMELECLVWVETLEVNVGSVLETG